MKALAVVLLIAGTSTALADDARTCMESHLMFSSVGSEQWSCFPQADHLIVANAYNGIGTIDLTEVINDDQRPVGYRGPVERLDVPMVAQGE